MMAIVEEKVRDRRFVRNCRFSTLEMVPDTFSTSIGPGVMLRAYPRTVVCLHVV